MKKYTTAEVVNLTAGLLELNEDQARRRKHLIEPVDGEDGIFKIAQTVQFKAGETFGYEGSDMNSGLSRKFKGDPVGTAKKEADEKAAADLPDADNKPHTHGMIEKAGSFFTNLFGKISEDDLDDDERAFVGLITAIEGMDPDDGSLWTKQSGPKLNALREMTGNAELTDHDRDAAWEACQQKNTAEICDAIDQLDPANPEQWTDDNDPDVKAIEIGRAHV